MVKIRQRFAKNLKKVREDRKMTQEALAEKLKINVRYIQQLEGKNPPNVKLDTLAVLATALKVSPKDFLI